MQRAQETSLRWWELWGRCPHGGQVTSVSFFLSSYVKGRKLPRKRYSVNLCEVIYLHVCQTEPKVESMKFRLFQYFSHVSMEKRKRQNCWVNKSLFFPEGGSHQDSLIDHPPALGNTPGKASEIFEGIMNIHVSAAAPRANTCVYRVIKLHRQRAWGGCFPALVRVCDVLKWFHSAGDDNVTGDFSVIAGNPQDQTFHASCCEHDVIMFTFCLTFTQTFRGTKVKISASPSSESFQLLIRSMRHSRPAAGARLFIFQAADAPWVTEDEEGEEERCRDRQARGASAALQLHVCSWTCSPVTFGSCSQVWSAARETPQVHKPPVVLSSFRERCGRGTARKQ